MDPNYATHEDLMEVNQKLEQRLVAMEKQVSEQVTINNDLNTKLEQAFEMIRQLQKETDQNHGFAEAVNKRVDHEATRCDGRHRASEALDVAVKKSLEVIKNNFEHEATQKALKIMQEKWQEARQEIQEDIGGAKDFHESNETTMLALIAQVNRLEAGMSTIVVAGSNALPQDVTKLLQDIQSLSESLHTLAARTHNRQIKESKISCNCSHAKINEDTRKLGRRVTQVRLQIPQF
jgi:hypothetical protein